MTIPTTQRILAVLRRPWLRRTLIGLVLIVLLSGLFAYLALPGIVKAEAEKMVAEKFHRQLSIDHIAINPFALAVEIHGAKLLEADGKTTFVSFNRLGISVSLQSLFRLAPIVKAVQLDRPYVHLARTAANHYNFDDLLASDTNKPTTRETVRFAVYNIRIEGGRIDFDDQPVHAKHVVSDMSLGLPFISSLPSQVDVFVEPRFSAKVDDALLQIKGTGHPFGESKDASIHLDLDAVDLTRYVGYLPFKPQFRLPSASLNLHLSGTFQQPQHQAPQFVLKGSTALKALAVTELNGKPLLKLPQLIVTLDNLNVLSSKLAVSRIEIDDAEVTAAQGSDGTLNLARLAAAPAQDREKRKIDPKPETELATGGKSEWQLALGQLLVRHARVSFSDEQGSRPEHAGIDNFDLDVRDVNLNLQKQSVNIATIASSSADFTLLHGKVAPGAKPQALGPVGTTEHRDAKADQGYSVEVGHVAIEKWTARLEDRNLPQAAITRISAITIGAQEISNLTGKSGRIDVRAAVNQKGRLACSGTIGLAPLHTELALDLNAVDLMPLQPYFTDEVNLLLTRASLSTRSTLKLDQTIDGALKGTFVGDASVSDLATVDKLSANDFLRWKSLSFSGVKVQLLPLSVDVDQVALTDFFARVIVDPTGRINLQDVARKDGNEQKSLTDADGAVPNKDTESSTLVASTEKSAPISPLVPMRIGKVAMKSGKVRFSDNFIKPNFTANLMDLEGNVSNLSSDKASTAAVNLHGNVNSAPLNIVGSINPLSGNLYLDLKADVKGMELAPLSPYSGKYVGYDIEKGKLSFELAYHLENRNLEAQNRLVLDQLTFGNKIDSPSATTLPVQLAVALLRDRNGVIDIDLPIGGSLDDPQFSVAGIIFRVLGNLIAKAVTAPFALLGSLFGGGEELSWLEFEAGRHVVAAAGETKLASLAKALNDRPALKLEITGRFDPQADREGLQRGAIDRKVRTIKLKQLVANGASADVAGVTVSSDEYPRLLDRVYKDADFSKPRNVLGLQKDMPVADMERMLMANAKVSDDDLVVLGNQRAQAAKDWLVNKGQISADRIFVVAAKASESADKAKASRVDFSLR